MLPEARPKSSSPLDAEDGGAADDRWGGEDGEIMDRPHVGEFGTVYVASNESEGDSYPSKGGGGGEEAREVQARLYVVKSHYQVWMGTPVDVSHAHVAQCLLRSLELDTFLQERETKKPDFFLVLVK